MKVSKMWKAVVAAVVAGGGALSTALDDGTITMQEGVTAAVAIVVALAATYRVPNKQAPKHAAPSNE